MSFKDNNNRLMQLDDGDDYDDENVRKKTILKKSIVIEPKYDSFSELKNKNVPNVELPPGSKSQKSITYANILKVNISDKKLETSDDSSSGGNSQSKGFKRWITPLQKTTHISSYDFHFYNAHYGDVYDYIDVNLEASNMMFLIKRYARTNSDKTLLSISEEKSHKNVQNKILFTDNDDFSDRVMFNCYKKMEESKNSSGSQLRRLRTTEHEYHTNATLTYEFYPNIIYNINFKPKCSQYIAIDHLKPVNVYINGNLLSPGDAPEDFDEEIIE